MKIRCPHCSKEYVIKEELVKSFQGKDSITIPCPSCKGAITIDLTNSVHGNVHKDAGNTTAGKDYLTGNTLKERIFKTLKDLPPMPQVAQKARKILSDPNSSFSDLAKVIESDQGIVTRVLKMANSPYYGRSGNVSSVHHAAAVLGAKTLMEVLNLACSSEILGQNLDGYDLVAGELWKHSLAVASGSQIIARRVQPGLEHDAFSAGLIHDVGKLILDPYIHERKAEFLGAEKRLLGFDHAELAAEVCDRWQIPKHITLPIRYHHDPGPSDNDPLTYIVHMADAIAMMSGIGAGIDGMLYAIHPNTSKILKLQEDDVIDIMADIASYVEKTTHDM